MAEYSNKSLIEKLGIKEGNQIYLVNSPTNYEKEFPTLKSKIKIIEQNNNFIN